ncbi:hypothetical protein D3C77_315120 [compost metagenome]
MVGGGNGSLGEATMAYLENKPIIVLTGSGGWADRLKDTLYDGKYFDERKNIEVLFTSSISEAVEMAISGDRGNQRIEEEKVSI